MYGLYVPLLFFDGRVYGPYVRLTVHGPYGLYSYSVQWPDSKSVFVWEILLTAWCHIWLWILRGMATTALCILQERNVENHRYAGWEAGHNVEVIAALPILSSKSWNVRTPWSTTPCFEWTRRASSYYLELLYRPYVRLPVLTSHRYGWTAKKALHDNAYRKSRTDSLSDGTISQTPGQLHVLATKILLCANTLLKSYNTNTTFWHSSNKCSV